MPEAPRGPAHVVTVLNLKGGVGKTHTTWLLAAVCQERERRVLLFDTDAQGNLSGSFLGDESPVPGVERLLHPASDGDVLGLIRRTRFAHIDLVPASPAIAPYDLSDQTAWEKADLHLSLVQPIAAVRGQYDMILFDCPPRLGLASFAALCASDAIIIPMEAADWGAQGIMQVTEAVRYVQQHYNPRLRLLGYLVSRFRRPRSYQQSYLKQLRSHFGPLAFDTTLPDRATFEKSVTDRVPITLHAPRSEEAGIARQLFDEVQSRLGGGGVDTCRPGREADVRHTSPSVVAAS